MFHLFSSCVSALRRWRLRRSGRINSDPVVEIPCLYTAPPSPWINSDPVVEVPCLYSAPPLPWIPKDPSTSPKLESKLLRKIKSAVRRLNSTRIHRQVLAQIRSPEFQSNLSRALSSESALPMVIYGIGRIDAVISSRIQLALAFLLRRELPIKSIEVFDPILSGVECAVLKRLGLSVLTENEMGRRVVAAPTMFFMPYCDLKLYDNLLDANWVPERLNRMVLLGNSFGEYEELYEGTLGVSLRTVAPLVKAVVPYVTEMEMETEKAEDEEWIRPLLSRSTKWHFFKADWETEIRDG